MATYNFELEIEEIDFDALVSKSDFQKEAVRLLPLAIEQIAKKSAEVAWDELQKGIQGTGFKPDSSGREKNKFIDAQCNDITQQMTDGDKRKLVNAIIAELHERKSTT